MENPNPAKPGPHLRIPVLGILYVVSGLVIAYYGATGWKYYTAPIRERPRMAGHMRLKPGGDTGHGLGVIGGLFILSTMAYSARKKMKPLKRIGTLPGWLNAHVCFGTVGPLLVVLHTGFKVNGLVAVAFWAMVAVTASGFVGRFLMRQIPRDIKGHALDVEELVRMRESLRRRLLENSLIDASIIVAAEQTASTAGSRAREPLTFMVALILNNAFSRIRIARLVRHASAAEHSRSRHASALNRIAFEEALLNRRILLLKKSQAFFKNWHRIHKPFTTIMFAIVLIHVGVAVVLGYRWIF
jgi:hypothetical protein